MAEDDERRVTMTRRSFVGGLAAAGATVPFTPFTHLASRPAAAGPAERKRPICVFSKHLQWLEYDEMARIASEIGFDGVDLTVRPGGHVLPERAGDDLPRAVEAVRGAGLDVDMITTAITSDDDAASTILRTAGRFGIRYYRMGYLDYRPELGISETLEAYRPQMRDLAALNERYGTQGAYQNHAGTRVGGPVWDVWLLVRDIDPEHLGCQYDIRHATVEGATSWPLGLRLLAPYVRITALKDFRWVERNGRWSVENVPLGEGMVDFDQYWELVRELDIAGPISLHFEYPIVEDEDRIGRDEREQKTIAAMKRDLQVLRSMLERHGLS